MVEVNSRSVSLEEQFRDSLESFDGSKGAGQPFSEIREYSGSNIDIIVEANDADYDTFNRDVLTHMASEGWIVVFVELERGILYFERVE